jgi:hypothetical protein
MSDHLIDVFDRLKGALQDDDVQDKDTLLETINALAFLLSALATHAGKRTISEEKFSQSSSSDMETLKAHTSRPRRLQ